MLVAVAMMGTAAMTITSCGKYEEGPGFTLLTKKARLTGVWDVKSYVDENGTTYADNDDSTVEFTKDGNATFVSPSFSISITGKWEFSGDKEDLVVTVDGDVTTSKILRLTNTELWTQDADGDIAKYEKK